jgi:uncharacterized protein
LPARFLILGSVSPWLMKGVTESLAGRVSFVDVAGVGLGEVGAEQHRRLVVAGGFPVPYLAETDERRGSGRTTWSARSSSGTWRSSA